MRKGSTVILSITIIALLFLQGITPGMAASQKEQCEAGVREEFNEYKARNAADTKRDGNMVLHSAGCDACSSQYQTCEDAVDTAVTDCARTSGWSPTNTCNADREPNYYACANQLTDCCLPGELVNRCGSLSDAAPTTVANPQKDCLDDDFYYINNDCVSFEQASKICQGKYGVTGYASSQTECDTCPKGQIFNGNECATDPSCPGLANVQYDSSSDECVCKKGFVPMSGGGCQNSTRQNVGFNVPSPSRVTLKAGASQTTTITLPSSAWTKEGGTITMKASVRSKDDAIKTITFSPSTVSITQGKSQTITLTISADDVDEFHQYEAQVQWSGYDNKYLYTDYTTLKIDVVHPDTPFVPEPTTETARQFQELRERQMPDMITRWKFGDEQAKTLYAKLNQLDPESSEDLKIMASFVAFVDAFNSLTNPVGTILEETAGLPDSGFGPPLVTRVNPFATIDSKLFAQTLIGVADHSVKLKEAHQMVQEMLKAGGQ
jgi:hypothetical protein